MKRINLTDENNMKTASWFNLDTAKNYKESRTWNGSNHISDATGSQWEHEELFITSKNRYILNRWSEYQGSNEIHKEITKEEALEWLAKNNHFDVVEEIDKDFLKNNEV